MRPDPKELNECRNCGALMNTEKRICSYCGSAQFFELNHPIRYFSRSRLFRKAAVYPALMLFGVVSFFWVYAQFDSFSQKKLMLFSPIWVFSFLFGYYGYTAEKWLIGYFHHQHQTVRAAFFAWRRQHLLTAVFYRLVPMLPFKSPLAYAAWGSFVSVYWFKFFYVVIWPSL